MPNRTASGLTLLAALTGLVISPAAAQNQPPRPASEPPTAGAVELADEPFRLDAVGLSVYLPVGAIAQTTRAGENAAVQIMPGGPNPTWLVNLQTPQSSNVQQTANSVAEEVLNQLLGSVGIIDRRFDRDGNLNERLVSTKGTVIEPVRPLELAGADPQNRRPAARFYVRLPRGEGEASVVRGYTVFQTGPGRFVTFDLVTAEPDFHAARRAYETMVATTRFEDTTSLASVRGAAVEAGAALFTRLSPSDYEAVIAMTHDRWYRLAVQPAGTSDRDAQELAYRRTRAWKGHRGELDPRRTPDKWKAADRQEGYLVRVDVRMLQDDVTIDSVAVYFMTLDRREEAWTIQMAIREPGRRTPRSFTETGARSGGSMSITTTGTGRENVAATPHIPEQGYITQVESLLLPYLLIQTGASGEYGFYVYQSETNNVRLRRDSVSRQGDLWTLATRLNDDREPQVSTFKENGDLVNTVVQEGAIWTPTTLQRLSDLWKSKRLPMD